MIENKRVIPTILTNPFFYDMKRTLTSKSTLILMILLVLIGFVIASQFISNGLGQTSTGGPDTQILSYYNANGTYHFLGFSWNQFGQGVSGVTFHGTMNYSQVAYNGGGTTSSNGETEFTINAPVSANYSILFEISTTNGISVGGAGGFPFLINSGNGTTTTVPAGQVVDLGASTITPIIDPNNASQREMQVFWSGANGSIPTNYALYYKISNSSQSTYLLESNMQLLGTLDSRPQTFQLPKLNTSTISDKKNPFMDIALYYPNGTSTSENFVFPLSQLYPPAAPPISATTTNSLVIGFFQNLFGIFIPLVAIVGSYTGYGKDRISGVIESVLAQPISRRGLSLSRFLSIFTALAIAISIAVALIDAMVFYYTGGLASSTLLIASTLAFFVELAAFIGIMMFFSHVVRSSGTLIGIGIGLFMLIDFFWGLIIGLVAGASSTGYNTAQYGQLVIIAQFINPAQFVSLVDTYLTHVATFVGLSSFSLPMTPTSYGISVLSMTATAVIWIALPLGAFIYLSTRRD